MALEAGPMPNDARDEDTGQFTENYPATAFTDALDGVGTATTAEVADMVGCDRDTAYRRLRTLADAGNVERREVGNSLLWSIPDN